MAVSGAGDVCGGGGAGAGGSSAPVLRLSQNFHPLIQKKLFFKPFWASAGFWAHTLPPVDM